MKKFYLYIVLLLSLGCKAQEFDLRNMKRFDEKVFKDWEVDIRTKRLILQSYFFYNCQIGIWKDWSKTGKLIKEVDCDEPYKLSVKDIITLVNQKFNIDLLDMNLLLNVDRYNRSVPIYIISITKPNTRGQEIRYITISADNGEVLFDKTLLSEKDFNDNMNDIYQLEGEKNLKRGNT